MKYRASFLALLVFILVCGLFIGGCDKDSGTDTGDDLTGTWELNEVTMNSKGQTVKVTPEQAGVQITLELNSDGSFSVTEIREGVTAVETGTWHVDGNQLIIEPEDEAPESIPFSLDGNRMTISQIEMEDIDNDGVPDTVAMQLEFIRQAAAESP